MGETNRFRWIDCRAREGRSDDRVAGTGASMESTRCFPTVACLGRGRGRSWPPMANRLVRVLSGCVVLWLVNRLSAGESRVEINPALQGTWRTPEAAWDGRVLLLFHGFADDMDGAGDLFKTLSGHLASNGIASLRINFRGEGDRFRTNITSTFRTRLEDAASAVQFARRQSGVKPDRIGALGWSLGGATAMVSAGESPDRFRCLVLWSTASGDMHAGVTGGNFARVAAQADREGIGSLEIPGWKTVTLRKEFFESYRGVDTDRSLARYPGALLSIRGTEDYLPKREPELLKLAPGRPKEAILIGGADHIFNVFQPALGHSDRVVALTVDWVKRVL